MWIKSFEIRNYMSFDDSGQQELARRVNVIVGQNNAGKTALLKAFSLGFPNLPHRNLSHRRDHVYYPNSELNLEFCATGAEIRNVLLTVNVQIPIPSNLDHQEFLDSLLCSETITFYMQRVAGGSAAPRYPSHRLFSFQQGQSQWYFNVRPNEQKTGFLVSEKQSGSGDSLGPVMLSALQQKTYFFDAQRLNVGRCPIGNRTILDSNASNLAEVLLNLQHNRFRFDRLNEHLRQIFPSINSISVRPAPDNGTLAEILVWSIDPATERDDLAIPLNESGTGIGQVLAILYVVLAADANVLVIDEPNSFLHPAASRQLVKLLREFRDHQYIISTHSPEVIAGTSPERLLMLRFQDQKTTISVLQNESVKGVQEALTEVGARLSDVFGADAIVWAEGPTEEACFQRVLKAMGVDLGSRVSIVALRNTGDLQAKRSKAEAIWEIYQRLSQTNALMPRALAFSFDREGRTKDEIKELKSRSNGTVQFLPRRMFENYLLHPGAIAAHLGTLPTFVSNAPAPEDIQKWIDNRGDDPSYFADGKSPAPSDDQWCYQVDGARLLNDLYSSISNTQESYRKVTYAIELVDWILANDRAHLNELISYVCSLIPAELRGG
jgi:predicted ATPase